MQQDTGQQGGRTPPGLADGTTAAVVEDAVVAEQRRQAHSGANWFFWIAAFSIINSVVLLSNGQWSFLIGLGVTQLIDGIAGSAAAQLGGTATVIALVLDAMVAGFFIVMGLMSRRGFGWAFLLGMAMYALDALLFLFVKDWLSIAFHAFVLYCIYRGFTANGKLRQSQALQ